MSAAWPYYNRGERQHPVCPWRIEEESTPNADYDHLTPRGSFQRRRHCDVLRERTPRNLVSKVITLDNLRVPFVLSEKDEDPVVPLQRSELQDRPRVLPTPEQAKLDGHRHRQDSRTSTPGMSDRGPEDVREQTPDARSVPRQFRQQRPVASADRQSADRQARAGPLSISAENADARPDKRAKSEARIPPFLLSCA